MRSILFNTAAGWLVRIMAILVNLIGVPLALQTLGPTRFGTILIAMSIGSWAGLGNVGFGRVIGLIMARFFHKSQTFVARVVSCVAIVSLVFQTGFFFVCIAVLTALSGYINLGSDAAAYKHEFMVSTISILLTFNLWFFLSIFEGIDAGQHQLFRLYWYQIAAYLGTLVLLFTVFRKMPSIIFATLLLGAGFLAGNIMHAVDAWIRHHDLFLAKAAWRRKLVQALLMSSVDFTIISMAIGIIFQFTTGIFGLIVGPDAIINLGVFMRIMASVGGVILTVTIPMSNLIAGRLAKQDVTGAINAALWTGAGLLSLCAFIAASFEFFGEWLVSIWLRSNIEFDRGFLFMASSQIFLAACSGYATGVAVGFGNLRWVSKIHAVQAVAVLPFGYLCYHLFGQAGILMAMNIVLLVGAVASFATQVPFEYLRLRLGLMRRHPT